MILRLGELEELDCSALGRNSNFGFSTSMVFPPSIVCSGGLSALRLLFFEVADLAILRHIDLNVTDYLLKPFTFDRFLQAVDKAQNNLTKKDNAKEKSLELKNIKFSSKSLKYVFGDKIKDETFKTNLVKSLKTMINDNYLATEGDFIYFTKKGLTYFYLTND